MAKDLDLPQGCNICHGAPFIEIAGGAARCTCIRGRELYDLDSAKKPKRHAAGSPRGVAAKRQSNKLKSRRDVAKAAANDKEPGLFK